MLFLRGLRWRRGFSAAVLLVGMISAAVAAIGPLYARASSESTLTDELHSAGSRSGLAFTSTTLISDAQGVRDANRQLARARNTHGYGAPIGGESSLITLRGARNQGSSPSTMVWRDGQCRHLIITHGRCVQGQREALVPDAALGSDTRWRIGDTLVVRQGIAAPDGVVDGPKLSQVRIVGTYRPRDYTEAFWFDHPYFQSDLGPAVDSAVKVGLDAVFVVPSAFVPQPNPELNAALHSYRPPQKVVDVDFPLVPSRIRLHDVSRLRSDVAALSRQFPRDANPPTHPQLRTSLASVLHDAARDKEQVQNATLVVVLELAALSLLVLFQVVGGAVEARGDEIALAKLRGLRPRRTVLFALREPVGLLLVAAPLGLLLALLVTHLLAGSALVAGTPVALTSTTWLALAAAFAGSALAAASASAKTVTRPVLEQWRNTSAARPGRRWLFALDLLIAALAVATVVALRTSDHSRPRAVFLVAPALIVFAVALVGVRLLPRLGRRGVRRTRASKQIAMFLALRQTVRRAGGLRLATLLAVAAGLATFAICGEAVAQANRTARAHTELGTARVVDVQFEQGHDPQSIVDRVDPQQKWAMAAATWTPDGGPSNGATIVGRLLGVEPGRLPSAMYRVRGQLSPDRLAERINAPDFRPAPFRGTRLRVQLDVRALSGDRPTVELGVRKGNTSATATATAALAPGAGTYVAKVDCAQGCDFTGVTFNRTITARDTISGTVVVTGVAADDGHGYTAVGARLHERAAWRADQIGVGSATTIGTDPAGLLASFRSSGGSSPVLDFADSPTLVPVAATPQSTTAAQAHGAVYDYTGAHINYLVTERASPLPAVLNTGAMADLAYLRTRLPNFDRESAWTVWLGPHAPSDAIARLEHAGLLVQHQDSAAARVAQLGRQGPALGLLLLLVCAIAAAVLAVGGTAVALLSDARRRSFEMAALRVVGVPQRTLRRSAVAEQALLLGAAIVLGLPSGYAAAALVLPVVPEFSDPTPVVLRYSPPVLLALACAAAFGILLWLTALVAGRALARGAVPARLREAAR